MTNNIYSYDYPGDIAESPTFSTLDEAARAKQNRKRYPNNQAFIGGASEVINLTVGDIFDKPSLNERRDWKDLYNQYRHAVVVEPNQETIDELLNNLKTSGETLRDIFANDIVDSKILSTPLGYINDAHTKQLKAVFAWRSACDDGLEQTNETPINGTNVALQHGGKGVLQAIGASFDVGDEVLVFSPGWPTNYDLFRQGVRVVVCNTENGIPTAQDLIAVQEQHPNIKGILINSPSNPTGDLLEGDQREQVFKTIEELFPQSKIILDEPYWRLTFDDEPTSRSKAELEAFKDGKLTIVKSLSKEYGLADWRIGAAISNDKALLKQINDYTGTENGLTSGYLDMAVLPLLFGEDYIKRNREQLKKNRDILVEGLNALEPHVSFKVPRGTLYSFVDFSKFQGMVIPEGTLFGDKILSEGKVIETPQDVLTFLSHVAGINVVPGNPFYGPNAKILQAQNIKLEPSWSFRIGFSCAEKDLKLALGNLKQACENYLSDPTRHVGTGTTGRNK